VKRVVVAVVASLLVAAVADAQPPKSPQKPPPVPVKAPPPEAEVIAKYLREMAQKKLPDPLTKSNQNWGHQTAVTVINRHREGLRIWTEPVQEMRNDGVWRRIEIRIPDPSKLTLSVTELTYPQDGKVLATVAVACDRVDLKLEQQVWRNGHRLYAGESHAHCKAGLVVKFSANTKTELKKGGLLPVPEVTVQVKATESQLFYDDIIFDRTGPFDGESAKAAGDLIVRIVKAVKPDLENDLQTKANAAIVKAAGTREFKVALDKILSAKK
jgi:hypothetical protein